MKKHQFIDKLANLMIVGKEREAADLSRRVWLQNFGLVSASSAVMWACGGDKDDDKAKADTTTEKPAADAEIVKVALELESEAIDLYTAAAGLDVWTASTDADQKALDQAVLAIAASFLAHHKTHMESLKSGLKTLQGMDATITDWTASKDSAAHVKAATDAGADLTSVKGILRLAAGKEGAAAQAYLSQASNFTVKDLAVFSAQHGGDEAAHYGVLRAALFALYGDTTAIATADKVIPAATAAGFDTAIKY